MGSERGDASTNYTWQEATTDIALTTQLTLRQSSDLTFSLQYAEQLDAFDAAPIVTQLLNAIRNNSYEEAGACIVRLLKVSS